MNEVQTQKIQSTAAKLREAIQELNAIGQRMPDEALEKLQRWKDRTARTLATTVNETEARKFTENEITQVNVDPETNLDKNISIQRAQLSGLLEDILSHPNDYFGEAPLPQVPGGALDSTYEAAFRLIHPEIVKIARGRFTAGYYADSVETAFKAINSRVKSYYKLKTGIVDDGASLMHSAFSPKKAIIVLGDVSTDSGFNVQQGYMEIFAGSISAIRNPKAHEIVEIDATHAIHFLFLASLQMYRLDEAKVSL